MADVRSSETKTFEEIVSLKHLREIVADLTNWPDTAHVSLRESRSHSPVDHASQAITVSRGIRSS